MTCGNGRMPTGLVFIALVCLWCQGCTKRVEYGSPTAQETVTPAFGSTDLQIIAAKMVRSLLSSPFIQEGNQPVVLVGRVRNKTDEHIDTKAITDKIRTTLVQSGKVRFVAGEVREEIEKELEYQAESGNVSEATRKRIGEMVGPGYILTGEITNIRKEAGRRMDVYFLITLNLVDIETGLIKWADEKEIRKGERRPLFGW